MIVFCNSKTLEKGSVSHGEISMSNSKKTAKCVHRQWLWYLKLGGLNAFSFQPFFIFDKEKRLFNAHEKKKKQTTTKNKHVI